MPRADFAEFLLALSTTPERAASIAGDLLDHKGRSAIVFWLDVIRIAVLQAWRQLTDSPVSILSMALRTYVFDLVATALGSIGLMGIARAFFASGGFMSMRWISLS